MIVGTELIATEAAKVLTNLVIQTAWNLSHKQLDKHICQVIFQASEHYINAYQMRHGILKILGMRQPVAIDSVYTVTHVMDELPDFSFASLTDLEMLYRSSEIRRFQPEHFKRVGLAVANENSRLMVLGSPGAGKSTFLRKIGLEALKGQPGRLTHSCIPVFIELKRFNTEGINIQALIIEEFRICGFPNPEKFVVKALSQGQLLVLLDGLDEVPRQYVDHVLQNIQDFVTRYDSNRFIASCRTAAYHHKLPLFTDVVIADFDDTQILQFINQWFQSERDQQYGVAHQCWELLQHPDNAAAKELAYTPLLLTFLCLVYDKAQHFPDNRGSLYRKALDILLEEWAAEKRISREVIYQGLHTELETDLLTEIAYHTFEQDRLFFSKKTILERIQAFLSDTLDAPKELDNKAVLNAIEVQQGILVKRAEDIYSFSHLTLQEYLTAQYICDRHLTDHLISQHLEDDRWHEVFLSLAGLMKDKVHDLLQLLDSRIQSYVESSSRLHAFIQWADRMTSNSGGAYLPVATRAVMLYIGFTLAFDTVIDRERQNQPASALLLMLHRYPNGDPALARRLALTLDPQLTRDFSLAFPFDLTHACDIRHILPINLAFAMRLRQFRILEEDLAIKLIAGLKALEVRIQILAKDEQLSEGISQLRQIWFQTLQINPELMNLSHDDLNKMAHYLKANLLMVQCKNSAVRVSRKIWQEIETKMLTVNSAFD